MAEGELLKTGPVPTVASGRRAVDPEEKKRLVRALFDPIASTYDLADTILSAGLDARWRKTAVALLELRGGQRVLDLCGGTAGLAALAARDTAPGGLALVADFNAAMIAVGRDRVRRARRPGKILFVQGDAEDLGFPAGVFDAVTVGFGLRNLALPERGLREMHRVLKPGGKLMILEFSLPRHALIRRLYHFYSFKAMPFLAGVICGASGPFQYLAESIRLFPPPEEVAVLIARAGFSGVSFRRLTNGIAVVYLAWKPEVPERAAAPGKESI
jgi:demethylmenaquinone methyltransferase / 2-methoxy-6-polyprenyl-1,4-benzoquinol methylase